MTDSEKIAALRQILAPVIDWYLEVEADIELGHYDDSYLYDCTIDEFDNHLRRINFQAIIEVLK